jgi:hypothetical protein
LNPLLCRTIKAKEVFHPFSDGEDLFSIGTIKVNEEELISCHQDVFELEVSMKEPCLVKFLKEKASGSDGFSLKG